MYDSIFDLIYIAFDILKKRAGISADEVSVSLLIADFVVIVENFIVIELGVDEETFSHSVFEGGAKGAAMLKISQILVEGDLVTHHAVLLKILRKFFESFGKCFSADEDESRENTAFIL